MERPLCQCNGFPWCSRRNFAATHSIKRACYRIECGSSSTAAYSVGPCNPKVHAGLIHGVLHCFIQCTHEKAAKLIIPTRTRPPLEIDHHNLIRVHRIIGDSASQIMRMVWCYVAMGVEMRPHSNPLQGPDQANAKPFRHKVIAQPR